MRRVYRRVGWLIVSRGPEVHERPAQGDAAVRSTTRGEVPQSIAVESVRRTTTDRAPKAGARAPEAGGSDRPDHFRPDIEGLRAVAVVLVLLYHARIPGFGGGFVGVDVFFVVSGFLITGLLVRELETTGRVSLVGFYARRARRLLPAAALALSVTLIAAALLLPPLRVPDVAGDAAAAAPYASNIRFAAQATDYLQAELDPSPLLHFWSLGVEEQFYLFWPTLVLLAATLAGRRGRFGQRAAVAGTVAVVGAGSLALSLWLTDANAPWAFFSLPTRAWELGTGAMLALAASRLASLPGGVSTAAGWGGLAMVGASALVIDTGTPFPGVAALLPVGGTALVIAAGLSRASGVPTYLLGRRLPRWLGRISYSLYLWHWPIIVLPVAAFGGELPLAARAALALAAVPVAAASQRWVEDPIRRGRWVGHRPGRNLAMAGALTLSVAVLSSVVGAVWTGRLTPAVAVGAGPNTASAPSPNGTGPGARASGTPAASGTATASATSVASVEPTLPAGTGAGSTPAAAAFPLPADLLPPLIDARSDAPRTYSDGCHLGYTETVSGPCAYGLTSSTTTVVLFGDSHAAQWFPALERLATEGGWRLVSLTKSGCMSVDVSVWNTPLKRPYTECDTWRRGAFDRIAAEHPALVVVSNSHQYWFASDGTKVPVADRPADWDAGLARTLARLAPVAGGVVLIGDTPRPSTDVPVCLSSHLDDVRACATARSAAVDAGRLAADARIASDAGAAWVDPSDWVCPSDPCPAVIGRFLVYRDTHHLATPIVIALRDRLAATLTVATP
jgi:peptidoglycan/LPS O-acetylase OafA/YrhL